jgi:tRNA dimethylallyltransferase
MAQKTCIIIAGPTAVGKTGVAIALAKHFNTDIISADSRQCYKELNIAVAKPSAEQLQQVKHYFINSHSVTEEVNAGLFEQYAIGAVNEIFLSHNVAVMVGGTGLYIKAFCEGMDDIPTADIHLRNEIASNYNKGGLTWLQKEIKEKDPEWFETGEIQNPQRIMRALEVVSATGKSIFAFRKEKKVERNFSIIKIGLTLPRTQLYHQINRRVDEMMNDGLEAEALSLIKYRNLNALQTVGYRELFDCFDGAYHIDRAIDLIKKNTRHYAKRQLTWFTKDETFAWYSPLDYNQLIKHFHNLV